MGHIWQTILGVVIAALLAASGSGIIRANNDAINAEDYLHTLVSEYSESNFSPNVLQKLKTEAAENGYVFLVEEDNTVYLNDGNIQYVIVRLEYHYSVPFLGVDKSFVKRAVVY